MYLTKLRERSGYKSQRGLADAAGISPATLSRIESGLQKPTPDTLMALWRHLKDTTYEQLMEAAGYMMARRPTGQVPLIERLRAAGIEVDEEEQLALLGLRHSYRLPVLGTIRAGQPMEMIRELAEDWEDADAGLIRGREAFILRVSGDSMIGDNIFDGDRVVVIHTPDHSPSDICVVAIDGLEATLKRVKCHDDVCVLVPSNPEMEPMVYPAQDVHVIGVVVEVRHRLKR